MRILIYPGTIKEILSIIGLKKKKIVVVFQVFLKEDNPFLIKMEYKLFLKALSKLRRKIKLIQD